MSAPNIQVRNDPQTVTGGTSGTKLIGPTTVEGNLTVTGTITQGGGSGLTIAAAGRVTTASDGSATIATTSVQTTSAIFASVMNDTSGAVASISNIVPGVSFDLLSTTASTAELSWMVVNP